jgi:hypothetical protein
LEGFLARLQARGIRLDGEVVHPRIGVGTVTGRVTYTDPPLQTMPKVERPARLGPVVAGRRFIKADYGQIEPRILLWFLRRNIDWQAREDLYRTIAGDEIDRDAAKKIVNTIINGGRRPAGATGRLVEFSRAADLFRGELALDARADGYVFTLNYRLIPLAADEPNFAGKVVNYVIQGTAADIFNAAVLRVDAALTTEGLPAAVALLLFDELWVECDPAAVPRVVELVRREMEGAALALGIVVPVRLDDEAALALEIAEERAAIQEFDGGLSREAAARLTGALPWPASEDLSPFPWEVTV